jgi:hypothetical protein
MRKHPLSFWVYWIIVISMVGFIDKGTAAGRIISIPTGPESANSMPGQPPGRHRLMVWRPAPGPAHRQRRGVRREQAHGRAPHPPAHHLGAGNQSRERPLGRGQGQRSWSLYRRPRHRPLDPRRRGARHDRAGLGARRGHGAAGADRQFRRRVEDDRRGCVWNPRAGPAFTSLG